MHREQQPALQLDTRELYRQLQNSFMPCQKTTRCQFEGDSPSNSRGNILFPGCNRSQRRYKAWKLAGAYEVSARHGACPWEAQGFSTATGEMHRALLGASLREEKLIAEKAEKKQCAEREDHSRCRYFPVSRHITSTFQASPSSVY